MSIVTMGLDGLNSLDEENNISLCTINFYAFEFNGPSTQDVKIKLFPGDVQYKTNVTVISKIITVTPDPITGYCEIDLIETENMALNAHYVFDFGEKSYYVDVPDQAEAVLWHLAPKQTDISLS